MTSPSHFLSFFAVPKISRRLLSLALLILGSHAPSAPAQLTNQPGRQTLYYIPHTHWEGAVFKTREEYLEMGLPNILKALQLLKQYPEYKFALDQVAYFKPFLERYPEEAAAFRKFVAEGRLQIVGGMDVMPDDVKPGGELFVRQMQYGKQYCREQLGVDVTVAWMLDTFGHHPQLPQLLKLAGYQSFWFCRGVPRDDMPSEFFWQGIDGTRIPAVWLPGFYGLFYGPPRNTARFTKFFEDRFNALNIHVNSPERVGLAGVDVSEPESYVTPFLRQFNERPNAPFTIRYSVPTEFDAIVAQRTNTPVMSNDFNPIFQGTYSSRIELKQTTRLIEQRLLTAEKLGAISSWLGVPADDQKIWRAWEPVLFNQTHDLASGVMTDHVYDDVKRGYDFSAQLADELIASGSETLLAHIDTTGEGIPIVVFNPLGWSRTDVAEVEIGFTDQAAHDLNVVDASGITIPHQVLHVDRYADNAIKRAKLCFAARDIPPLGYATYHVLAEHEPPPARETAPAETNSVVIENEYYRVTVHRLTGEMTSLFDKQLQWEALAAPANIISREPDQGDLWELYHGLDGGSYIAHTNQQGVPKAGHAQLSSEYSDQPGSITRGPVFSEFSVAHPFGKGAFATRIRLYSGIKRVDIETDLTNNEKFVRYQVQFPTSVKDGRNVQSIPFGSLERPTGIEFPAQQWVDYSDSQHGVALLNFGLPGNLVTDGTLLLSLLRSHNVGGYGFGGGYEPGMSSETGFELGVSRTFHYALMPHAGSWREGAAYQAGLEFNQPLLVFKSTAHTGTLPARWGMLEVSQSNVVLTAIQPGSGNTTLIRVYEASGVATSGVKIQLNTAILAANEASLLADTGADLKNQKNAVQFDLHPFEIRTIKLKLGASGK